MPDLMHDRNLNRPGEVAGPPAQPERPPAQLERPAAPTERVKEEETSAEVISGGSLAEAVCGIAAIVLAIVALAGMFPTYLAGVAAIVVGSGLFLEGVAIGTRLSRLLREVVGPRFSTAELGGGMTAEFLAGGGGIVLGILALLQIVPVTLLAVAAIVFGGALLLGAGATGSLNYLIVEHHYRAHEMARRVAGAMVSTGSALQVLAGLGAIVLGIVALSGGYPLTLSLVAFLVVGSSLAISGLALGAKMLELVRR